MESDQETKTQEGTENSEQKNQERRNESLLKLMLASGVHYGRAKRFTHPSVKEKLLPNHKSNIEIFDLGQTLSALDRIADLINKIIDQGKSILFVATQPAAQETVKKIATELSMPYLNTKWVAGFLTNFETIKSRLTYFKELSAKAASGEINNYPIKEAKKMERELEKMKQIYGGVATIEKLPDFVFIINVNYPSHRTVVREAIKTKIPIIAIVGSDNNIEVCFDAISANDKAPRSINFIVAYLLRKLKPRSNQSELKIETETESEPNQKSQITDSDSTAV